MGSPAQGQFWTPHPLRLGWGIRQLLTIPAPAVKEAWTWTVPGEYLWRPLSFHASLTTSAEAGNRHAHLKLEDPRGTVVQEYGAGFNLEPSKTTAITYVAEFSPPATSVEAPFIIPFPLWVLEPQWKVTGVSEELATGDQWSSVALWVECFEPRPSHPLVKLERLVDALDMLRLGEQIASE